MADYWKSNAKKHCDFCKCWIADNKPSVDFHEKGKRHKENVALRLKNLSRQSVKDQKEKQKLADDFKKMEKAALKAFLKDVERNADYTSQQLNKQLSEANSSIPDDEEKEEKKDKTPMQEESESQTTKVWYEAISDEGNTYYWNTETGESVWEPPEGGYKSLDEQKKLEEEKQGVEEKKEKETKRKSFHDVKQREETEKLVAEEKRAFLEREKMKERRVKEETLETESKTAFGPAPRANPYGSWVAVPQKQPKKVDLQLPQLTRVEIKVPVISTSEPEIKFKKKSIVALESEGSHDVSFKKRKLNAGSKRNTRQRLDDD